MTPPNFLFSLDFDGTLSIDAEPPVDPIIHLHLRRQIQAGAQWVMNTGRSLPHALEGLLDGQFVDRPAYLITRERDIHCMNQVGRWVAFGDWNERAAKANETLMHKARGVFKEIRKYLASETLADFISLPEDPAGIVASNTDEMADICTFVDTLIGSVPNLRYERNSIYLRFSHDAYSKGTALKHLAGALGLTPKKVFAAGDNFNDLTMLNPEIAWHLACPANALPEVQATVRHHGGYCASAPGAAGVAEAIERLDLPTLR